MKFKRNFKIIEILCNYIALFSQEEKRIEWMLSFLISCLVISLKNFSILLKNNEKEKLNIGCFVLMKEKGFGK